MEITKDTTVLEYIEQRIKFLENREYLPSEVACIQFAVKEMKMLMDFIETPIKSCDDSGCCIKWREL